MDGLLVKGFLIDGIVQKAGFRPMIKSLAKSFRLKGFVKNLDDYDDRVLVVCEGDNRNIEEFTAELEELSKKQKDALKEKEDLDIILNVITKKIESVLLSEKPDKEQALLLLEERKSILRKISKYETSQKPYYIEKITDYADLSKYPAERKKYAEADSFIIWRPETTDKEAADRLDEGIEALISPRGAVSNTRYDLIDTNFAILNVKYDTLSNNIKEGFQSFPQAFAEAFGVVLDKKYGLKPVKDKKKKA